ncbi:hypothetical protein ACEOUA_29095 [Pseudomonas aeruginosa]|jgi:hypothetical protein|uniref:hypothetical protein n=1 Tax=Pseudomonas aeruginosa TaxID=287 RepID=UPI00128F043D|nr:hypothetical protein [Pseudomonas aeruginosa]EKU4839395.1 hypothetical protein [Pseudomonas aeruginosa]EKW0098647.1 hypothetical protein [Pseudomonas aeruginosa]EKW6685838.1 hypothetical protein [Pseudomonas aeruginosa]EKX6189951.1 hypothetical protein [Pseudomonas aeruginosa]MDO5964211.1 hypothetical protein [Pseudomonas aeruginosa]
MLLTKEIALQVDQKEGFSVSTWTRAEAIDRGKAKMEAVIRWLAWFDYADRETLAAMLGVDVNGQSAFFKRLESSGFVQVEIAPGIRRRIYGLGDSGFEYALMLLPELELKRRRRLPAWVSLVHSFSVQAAIIRRMPEIASIRPEKTLKHLRAVRLPDAIITLKDGSTVALEVELNHKSSARVFNIFLSHLKNIRSEHYERVLYVFPGEALCRLYREKFDLPVWPIYRMREGSTRLVLETSRNFDAAQVHQSSMFTFTVEELYSL